MNPLVNHNDIVKMRKEIETNLDDIDKLLHEIQDYCRLAGVNNTDIMHLMQSASDYIDGIADCALSLEELFSEAFHHEDYEDEEDE